MISFFLLSSVINLSFLSTRQQILVTIKVGIRLWMEMILHMISDYLTILPKTFLVGQLLDKIEKT